MSEKGATRFRLLRPEEIEVRVSTINGKGATLLLYKDARVDMNILDESGLKWKREHTVVNNNLFCTVSIWDDEIKEWVSRQDVGTESFTEKEKGQASDSFKRACFNWGIGRELYSAPFIWIGSDKYNGFISGKTPQGKDKYATYDRFSVEKIQYDDKTHEITGVSIRNDKRDERVFAFVKGTSAKSPAPSKTPAPAPKPESTDELPGRGVSE